jgi:hypothetical protein
MSTVNTESVVMHEKTSFNNTGLYHMCVGALIITFALIGVFLDPSKGVIISSLLFVGIGAAIGYAGHKAASANKKAILFLIIINGLQIFYFDLGNAAYYLILGPYLHLDILSFEFFLGFSSYAGFEFNSMMNAPSSYFRVSFIHLALFVYFLDQYRFIPAAKDKVWEREYTD